MVAAGIRRHENMFVMSTGRYLAVLEVTRWGSGPVSFNQGVVGSIPTRLRFGIFKADFPEYSRILSKLMFI